MSIQENAANIQKNRKRIFQLENLVRDNKAQAYLTRSTVIENQALVIKNYQAAFGGNRQLANANTEDIFRNRLAIVRNYDAGSDPVKKNYKEAMINKITLDALDYRSKMNGRVTSISDKLAEINARLIEVNSSILQANEDIVNHNSDLITQNRKWIEQGIPASDSITPESNAALIAANRDRIKEIFKRAEENAFNNKLVYEQVEANRAKIETNRKNIYERRARILENRANIKINQNNVADFIAN